jgi:hypothetical protein
VAVYGVEICEFRDLGIVEEVELEYLKWAMYLSVLGYLFSVLSYP